MEFSNEGASFYHKLQALYVRSLDGPLNRITGPKKLKIRGAWHLIQPQLPKEFCSISDSPIKLRGLPEGTPYPLLASPQDLDFSNTLVYEIRRKEDCFIVGLILRIATGTLGGPFEKFFAGLLLDQIRLYPNEIGEAPELSLAQQKCTDAVVELFNFHLRHESSKDQWNYGGRNYFEERIRHFTSRNAKIEFCLPAFPCKSSNPEKVGGTWPDRGEELALLKLHSFVRSIEAVYEPGAKIWVISDGHVFSDCIGVDDDTVDNYGAKLIEMNQAIVSNQGFKDRVRFKSLVDIFDLKSYPKTASNLAHDLQIPEIDHFIATKVSEEAELCRRVLMSGCQSDKAMLRRKIDSQDSSLLALYRGFSRFMLEDLSLHPFTRSMSRSQRKKLAVKVSFEMIMRNQAYSNLVEVLLPDHVRLSIHAHTNSGPKFGIDLFDKATCRAASGLFPSTESGAVSSDLLHIPTPWHSCVIQFGDGPTSYVAKSKIVQDAVAEGLVTGGWVESRAEKGGYFALTRTGLDLQMQPNPLVVSAVAGVPIWNFWRLPLRFCTWVLHLLRIGPLSLGVWMYLWASRRLAA